MGLWKKVKKTVKKVTKTVGKSIRYANPVKAVKDFLHDPIGQMTLGAYSPIVKAEREQAKQRAAADQAAAEADAKTEKENQAAAERNRQSERRSDSEQAGSTADATQTLQQIQTLLNSNPTLLTSAEADDEETRRRLGKGNRLSGAA